MENFRGGFQNLYHREEPHTPGLPLATHIDPDKVKEEIPLEAEVKSAVHRLRPHRLDGHTHLRIEHFKQWQQETYPRDQSKTPP